MPLNGDPGALRVAVVGAGPAGIYAAEALNRHEGVRVEVDVLDRLPTPFGLVRYGVAPDHPTIKSVVSTLTAILQRPGIRFLGNVDVGVDLGRADLASVYDAIIYATGAPADRRLGIPGEDLPGSLSASEFVAWYNGHPDATADPQLDCPDVAVVGAGNVALDIARVLGRAYTDLANTDMPTAVLDRLRTNATRNVHVLARRGPQHANFSTKELRELAGIPELALTIDPSPGDRSCRERFDGTTCDVIEDRRITANLKLFDEWAARPMEGETATTVALRFYASPVEIIGRDRVEAVHVERTAVTGDGRTHGTGQFSTIPVGLVVRAIGYRGLGIPGLPFDAAGGVVPNAGGRIADQHGVVVGEYVAGWLKRGPTGVIGTNKVDAQETVHSLLEDYEAGQLDRSNTNRSSVDELLASHGVQVVAFEGWEAIERAELEIGASEGRVRSKITDWQRLVELGAGHPRARTAEGSELKEAN